MSGLLTRRGWPLALMKSANQVPFSLPSFNALTLPRVFLAAVPLIIITLIALAATDCATAVLYYAAIGAR